MQENPRPGTGGERFVPYGERTGNESIVYFTRDLSAAGLRKAYAKVNGTIGGRVGIKLHTGEKNGPNIIPRAWVRELVEQDLPGASIIETNTYYEGDRYTTEQHRETLAVNGWDFCPVDIIDDKGTTDLPVEGGKWFDHMTVGLEQEHRHRLRGRAHRQEGDPLVPRRRAVEHRDRGAHGAHQRVDQGDHRPLRQARLLRQRHAQHVGVVRLRGHLGGARRDAQRGQCATCPWTATVPAPRLRRS